MEQRSKFVVPQHETKLVPRTSASGSKGLKQARCQMKDEKVAVWLGCTGWSWSNGGESTPQNGREAGILIHATGNGRTQKAAIVFDDYVPDDILRDKDFCFFDGHAAQVWIVNDGDDGRLVDALADPESKIILRIGWGDGFVFINKPDDPEPLGFLLGNMVEPVLVETRTNEGADPTLSAAEVEVCNSESVAWQNVAKQWIDSILWPCMFRMPVKWSARVLKGFADGDILNVRAVMSDDVGFEFAAITDDGEHEASPGRMFGRLKLSSIEPLAEVEAA